MNLGTIFVMLGVFASIGGNPMGLSLQSMGQSNAQYYYFIRGGSDNE